MYSLTNTEVVSGSQIDLAAFTIAVTFIYYVNSMKDGRNNSKAHYEIFSSTSNLLPLPKIYNRKLANSA